MKRNIFLRRVAARLQPVQDDMDLFSVHVEDEDGSCYLTVVSSTESDKIGWVLVETAYDFSCDRRHAYQEPTSRSKTFSWDTAKRFSLDHVVQVAQEFQNYMLATVDE